MTDHAEREKSAAELKAQEVLDYFAGMNREQMSDIERDACQLAEAVLATETSESEQRTLAIEEAMRDRIIEKAGLAADDCDVESADPADHVSGGIEAMRQSLDATIGQLVDREIERPRDRGLGIGMPAAIVFDEFGLLVHDAFGELPYHVGSSLKRKRGWRDVDVRLILEDDAFTALGFGAPSLGSHENPRWVAMVRAFSALGREMTGLPIDFQIQAQGAANERNKGEPRSCLGVHAMMRRQPRSEP